MFSACGIQISQASNTSYSRPEGRTGFNPEFCTQFQPRDRLEAYPTLLPGVSSNDSSAPESTFSYPPRRGDGGFALAKVLI
jgi:hypothetical protein